jgi:two-component system sensor histidine kinase YesM
MEIGGISGLEHQTLFGRHRPDDQSITKRLGGIIVLQVSVFTFFFFLYLSSQVLHQYNNTKRGIFHMAALAIQDIVSKIAIAEEITRFPIIGAGDNPTPLIYRLKRGTPAADYQYTREVYEIILNYLNQNLFIDNIGMYDLDGKGIYVSRNQGVFYNSKIDMKSSWVIDSLAKRGGVTFIAQDDLPKTNLPKSSQALFCVSRTIMDGFTVKPAGIITVSILRSVFDKNFEAIKIFGDQEYAFLYREKNLICLFEDGIDYELINRMPPGKQNTTNLFLDGTAYVYSYLKADKDWTIVIRTKGMMIIGNLLRISIPFFIVIVFAIVFTLRIIMGIVKSVLDPLNKLVEICDQMEDYTFPAVPDSVLPRELKRLFLSFNAMRSRIDILINEILANDILKRDIEMRMLRMQINPHYLYNVLECMHIRAYANHDYDVSTMAELLGKNIQYGLKNISEEVTIGTEQRYAKEYVHLLSYHYADKIKVNFCIDRDILEFKAIKLILQPIIENSIKHGIIPLKQLNIDIMGYQNGNNIELSIFDDGAGIEPEKLRAIVDGIESGNTAAIGLQNVHRRLRLCYGEGYGITLKSIVGQGTTTVIKIPFGSQGNVYANTVVNN